MANNATTDYKALQEALKKQRDATTGMTEKAALQSQIDDAERSRTEKLASDLMAYGKYATDGELNNAAGLMAQNQLGTGYDIQRPNLNKSYDNARQNANNDALSRGMARSSYVGDRLARLDTDRATALSGVDASQEMALQAQKAKILGDYRANTANALANEKKEFNDTVGAYYNDYQVETNKVMGNNDSSDDWKIPILQQARNKKILAQQAAEAKAAQEAAKLAAKGSGGSRGGGGRSSSGGGNQIDTTPSDTSGVEFNSGYTTTIDETSPYGIITDIDGLKKQGFTSAQIKANAKAALVAKQITGAQYQMYVQYAGRD